MLLAWTPVDAPDCGTLRQIRNVAPEVHVAAHEPAALLQQIHGLLARAADQTLSFASPHG